MSFHGPTHSAASIAPLFIERKISPGGVSVTLTPFARLVETGGTELREWPEPIAAAMAEASNEVLAELAMTSDLAGRIAASYRAYLAKAREWSKWSDAAMLKLRNEHPAG